MFDKNLPYRQKKLVNGVPLEVEIISECTVKYPEGEYEVYIVKYKTAEDGRGQEPLVRLVSKTTGRRNYRTGAPNSREIDTGYDLENYIPEPPKEIFKMFLRSSLVKGVPYQLTAVRDNRVLGSVEVVSQGGKIIEVKLEQDE